MTLRHDGVWVGFDLGGTKMLASVYDSSFEVIGHDRKSTLNSVSPKKNLKRIVKTIDQALAEAGLDRTAIRGIGIGCPGPVDMTSGVVHEAINLSWRDVPVGDWLTEKMDCPVLVVNDVDAGVYGEYRFGAARGSRCVVGIFPGTGIGGGCIYEGRILRGNRITCMEIGHFPINPGAPARGNNRCHTLEHVSSRLSIAAASAQAAYRGHAPHLAEHVGTEVATIRSGALSAAIDSGDTVIEGIVRWSRRCPTCSLTPSRAVATRTCLSRIATPTRWSPPTWVTTPACWVPPHGPKPRSSTTRHGPPDPSLSVANGFFTSTARLTGY